MRGRGPWKAASWDEARMTSRLSAVIARWPWIAGRVISEAVRAVEEQNDGWGPLRRPAAG